MGHAGPAPIAADVLVIGAGGAGMYAAIAAARQGADVMLLDKSMVGRGGATIMAQMTVAVALGAEEPDDWQLHFADTVAAGRGLCNQELARALCEDGPARILEMDAWGIGWARERDRMKQVAAPGHSRKRCVYVDILNTGPATARTLQGEVANRKGIRRVSNVTVTDLVVSSGRCIGAVGVDIASGQQVRLHASAVVLATGGLTRLYSRNSASTNMTGDGSAMALRAGASLVDMEFVQFFPIAHLAPRLVGMDPIMWDPFRYKLGGRLLNADMEEFVERYGGEDSGRYVATRDLLSHAILQEVAAGRGSPHGGAFLSFQHVPEEQLRAAFGPVIDRLVHNGIDLTRMPVEVAPMAHYHMGGMRCNAQMASDIPGLFGAGEVVGGAHGANRLSGNAITEAFVFGERAGRFAAAYAGSAGAAGWDWAAAEAAEQRVVPATGAGAGLGMEGGAGAGAGTGHSAVAVIAQLQVLMGDLVGPIRSGESLSRALAQIRRWQAEWAAMPVREAAGFNMDLQDWWDLRNMLTAAEAIAVSALDRRESRGAHFRTDFPEVAPTGAANIVVRLRGGGLSTEWAPVVTTVLEGSE